jgi:type IV secretory pathway VirB10-like protein
MEADLHRLDTPAPDLAFDLAQAELDEIPTVAGRDSHWPMAFAAIGALSIGALVFMQLSLGRMQREAQHLNPDVTAELTSIETAVKSRRIVYPAPPQDDAPDRADDLADELVEQPGPAAAPQIADQDRLRAPVLVVDLSQSSEPEPHEQSSERTGATLGPRAVGDSLTAAGNAGAQLNADERFASRLGANRNAKEVRASHLGDLSTTIVQGEVIPAVLDTALNSDIPGYARATVTRDVRGFDGSRILAPRGSRLIGQYRSGVALGQSRAFLIWTRLIRPDGASIELAAPATDGLGRGGLTGEVDHHFLERFGGGILLSLLNIGANAITNSSDTNIVIASGQSGGNGGGALNSGATIGPTVNVPQGTPVRVFVNQDLDFSTVGAAR